MYAEEEEVGKDFKEIDSIEAKDSKMAWSFL